MQIVIPSTLHFVWCLDTLVLKNTKNLRSLYVKVHLRNNVKCISHDGLQLTITQWHYVKLKEQWTQRRDESRLMQYCSEMYIWMYQPKWRNVFTASSSILYMASTSCKWHICRSLCSFSQMSCVSRGDGLESVVTRTACCFPLVHRVPAPVCDHEWYSPRMVSWDHFQEVSSKKMYHCLSSLAGEAVEEECGETCFNNRTASR